MNTGARAAGQTLNVAGVSAGGLQGRKKAMKISLVEVSEDHVAAILVGVDQQAKKIIVEGTLEEMAKLSKDQIQLQACVVVVNTYHTLNITIQWEREAVEIKESITERYTVPFELQSNYDQTERREL